MDSLSLQLKLLANGIMPVTKRALSKSSIAQDPNVIRILFTLAEEISTEEERHEKALYRRRFNYKEMRERNIAKGRPLRSGFPWDDDEHRSLVQGYSSGESISEIANRLERSPLGVIAQLVSLKILSKEAGDLLFEKITKTS